MENINFLENIATRLGQNATVKNVYGEPIVTDGKTIIPVAQIAYGFGGGYGHKPRKISKGQNAPVQTSNEKENTGEGLGGGGGMLARPKGVYEISKRGTRFIPAHSTQKLIAALLLGFLIKTFMTKTSRLKG